MTPSALLALVLLLQTPAPLASISGIAVHSITGEPVANVTVTLARTDVSAPPGLSSFLQGMPPFRGVTLPGEYFALDAPRDVKEGITAAGVSVSDIRQITIGPDGAASIATAEPVRTDAQGEFSFDRVTPGAYRLVFAGNGYARQEYRPIVLTAGQAAHIAMRVVPVGAVSGRIRDRSGHPIPDVPVQLIRFAYDSDGRKRVQVAASARTDDRGEYRLFFVAPGRYYLQAGVSLGNPNVSSYLVSKALEQARAGNAFPSSRDPIPDSYPNTYYPGVNDLDSAAVLEVRPGTDIENVDLTLSTSQKYSIRGRTVDAGTKQPAEWADIGLNSQSSTGGTERITGDLTYDKRTGSFELRGVSPGSYALTVFLGDAKGKGLAMVTVSNSDVDLGEVNVGLPKTISGRIRMDKEESLPAVLSSSRWSVRLKNASIDFQAWAIEVNPQSAPTANGTLRISNVIPGDYRVALTNLPDGFYVKEARFGESDALNGPIRMSDGVTDTLDIVIASDVGWIEGRVTGKTGDVPSGAQVVLVPGNRQRIDRFKPALADPDGRFAITGIAPGDYKLIAWESLEPNAFFDPELLDRVVEQGIRVQVGPSSSQTVDVEAIPASP